MNNEIEDSGLHQGMRRIEELIQAVEGSADPTARDHVRELTRAILKLHEAGLRKMVELIAQAGEPGGVILDSCAQDKLVSGLLLLHDLHPLGQEARSQQALSQLGPLLRQHRVDLELVKVVQGVVHLRTAGGNRGTLLNPALCRLVEGAILEAVPDVDRIEFEDALSHAPCAPIEMVPLVVLVESPDPCLKAARAGGGSIGPRQRPTPPLAGGMGKGSVHG